MPHIGISALSIAACLLVTGCVEHGSDKLGQGLQQQADELLVPALRAYSEERRRYPDSPGEIAVDMSWLPEDATWYYRLEDDGHYLFGIDYKASWPSVGGRTVCQYSSKTSDWTCWGHW